MFYCALFLTENSSKNCTLKQFKWGVQNRFNPVLLFGSVCKPTLRCAQLTGCHYYWIGFHSRFSPMNNSTSQPTRTHLCTIYYWISNGFIIGLLSIGFIIESNESIESRNNFKHYRWNFPKPPCQFDNKIKWWMQNLGGYHLWNILLVVMFCVKMKIQELKRCWNFFVVVSVVFIVFA